MGGGKGGGSQEVTQRVDNTPWAPTGAAMQNVYNRANQYYNQNITPQPYGNDRFVGFAPQQNQAMQLMEARALGGSPVVQAGQNQVQQTAQGDFLNANPYLDAMYDRAASAMSRNFAEGVMPSIDARFAQSGRFGGGLQAATRDSAMDQFGRSLEGLAANLYGQNFQQERGRQLQAAGLAPMLAQEDYRDIQNLFGVGQGVRGMAQEMLGSDMARFRERQQVPQDRLDNYIRRVSGAAGVAGGGSGTTSEPMTGGNPLMGAVGGGLAGWQLGDQIGGSLGGISAGTLGGVGGALLGALF